MMMFGPNTPTPSTTPWARVGAVVLVAGLALTVLVLAFTWSTKTAAPRNFPLAVAGPEQVTSTIAEQLFLAFKVRVDRTSRKPSLLDDVGH